MSFVVQSYDRTGRQCLGSDGTMFCYDLKTLRGVENRIKRWGLTRWHRLAVTLKIFSQSHSARYNEASMKFIKTIQLCKPMDAIGTFEHFEPFEPTNQPFQIPPSTFKPEE